MTRRDTLTASREMPRPFRICARRGPKQSGIRQALRVARLGYIMQALKQGHTMSKTATVRARLEPALKEQAEGVLGELGLNATTAITMYYEQIVRRHAIPFDVSLPTQATLDAMQDAETRRGLTRVRDTASLFAALDSDD